MPHSNISIFIPHLGCPHKCSFCNQNSITGAQRAPSPLEVNNTCKEAFAEIKDKTNTEIAFFGGSFTAINRKYMIDLLECTQEFIGDGKFKGIRVSTRPDCINDEVLTILKKYNVTSIELGVQSMNDDVLTANDRGHTSSDVKNAVRLIKKYDFELGLQIMVGLYKSTPELDIFTAKEIVKLTPKTVRIYPVVIMENTKLGELFKSGEYVPYSLETAVDVCVDLISLFDKNDITIIKLGLHASEIVEESLLGGLYHPAFKELCENKIFYSNIIDKLEKSSLDTKNIIVKVSPKHLSKAIGQKRCNTIKLENKGYKVKFIEDKDLKNYEINIVEEERSCT